MVCLTRSLIAFFIAIALCLTAPGCASSQDSSNQRQQPNKLHDDCRDCLQPPLRKTHLLSHLLSEQERILTRDDYKKKIAPRITDVAYGPRPTGPLQDGQPIYDADNNPYNGPLNWHGVPFTPVPTDAVKDRTFRGRQVTGAHCFFARQPNRQTALFSVLVVHHPTAGDRLYLGGPKHPTSAVDLSKISNAKTLRLADQPLRCTFRDDQNIMGALILSFEPHNPQPTTSATLHAVFLVTASDSLRPSGRAHTIERSTGRRGGESEEVLVQLLQYPALDVSFIGAFPALFDALTAAEAAIPKGRFRLRKDFIYPTLPFQAFLEGSAEEFCPVRTECATPRKYLDVDIRPKITATRKEQDQQQNQQQDQPHITETIDTED